MRDIQCKIRTIHAGFSRPAIFLVVALFSLITIATLVHVHRHHRQIRNRKAQHLRQTIKQLQKPLQRIKRLEQCHRFNQQLLLQLRDIERQPLDLAIMLEQLARRTPKEIQLKQLEYLHGIHKTPNSIRPLFQTQLTIDGIAYHTAPEQHVFRLHRQLVASRPFAQHFKSIAYSLPGTHEPIAGEDQTHPEDRLPFRILAKSGTYSHNPSQTDNQQLRFQSPAPRGTVGNSALMKRAMQERSKAHKN